MYFDVLIIVCLFDHMTLQIFDQSILSPKENSPLIRLVMACRSFWDVKVKEAKVASPSCMCSLSAWLGFCWGIFWREHSWLNRGCFYIFRSATLEGLGTLNRLKIFLVSCLFDCSREACMPKWVWLVTVIAQSAFVVWLALATLSLPLPSPLSLSSFVTRIYYYIFHFSHWLRLVL